MLACAGLSLAFAGHGLTPVKDRLPGAPSITKLLRIESGVHSMDVTGVAFTSDDILVSASLDKTVRSWRVPEEGTKIIPSETNPVLRFNCGPDLDGELWDLSIAGKLCAVARSSMLKDSKFLVFARDSESSVKTINCSAEHLNPVESVAFSADGTALVSASGDAICLWSVNPTDGSCTRLWNSKQEQGLFAQAETIDGVRFTPAGFIVVSHMISEGKAASFATRFQQSGNTLRRAARLKAGRTLNSVCPLPNGIALAVDNSIKFWDGNQSHESKTLPGLEFAGLRVQAVALSPDQHTLGYTLEGLGPHELAAGRAFVGFYDLANQKLIGERISLPANPFSLAFSPKNDKVAVGCENGAIAVAEVTGKTFTSPPINSVTRLNGEIAWSAETDTFQVTTADGATQAYTLRGMRADTSFTNVSKAKTELHWDETNHWFTYTGIQMPFLPANFDPSEPYHALPVSRTTALAWSRNHLKLVSVSDGDFQYSNLDGFEGELKSAPAVSRDGNFIAVVCSNDIVRIWSTATVKYGKRNDNPPMSNTLFSYCLIRSADGSRKAIDWLLWNDDSATYAASSADAEKFLGIQFNEGDEKFATWTASASRREYNRLDLLAKLYSAPSAPIESAQRDSRKDYSSVAALRSIRLFEDPSGKEILPDSLGGYISSSDKVRLEINPVSESLKYVVDQTEARSLTSDDANKVSLVEGRNTLRVFTSSSGDTGVKRIPAVDPKGNPVELHIVYKNDAPRTTLPPTYVLSIGISSYPDPVKSLKFADQDADRIAARYRRIVPKEHIIELLNSEATKAKILSDGIAAVAEAVKKDPNAREANVIIFIAAHGLLDASGERPKWYILPADYSPATPTTGYEYTQFITDIRENIHCKNIILLADTCFSGGAVRSVTSGGSESTGVTAPQGDAALKQLGAADTSFFALVSSMPNQFSFEDQSFGAEDDATAYADGQEKRAVSDPTRGSGLFTHALLLALKSSTDASGLIYFGKFEARVRTGLEDAATSTQHKQEAPEPYFGTSSWEAQFVPVAALPNGGVKQWELAASR